MFFFTQVMFRRVPVPAHRFTPLKEKWMDLYQPIVKHMKLQIRYRQRQRQRQTQTERIADEPAHLYNRL